MKRNEVKEELIKIDYRMERMQEALNIMNDYLIKALNEEDEEEIDALKTNALVMKLELDQSFKSLIAILWNAGEGKHLKTFYNVTNNLLAVASQQRGRA